MNISSIRLVLLALLSSWFLAAPVSAQELLYQLDADPYGAPGSDMDRVGDVNGDGIDDFILGWGARSVNSLIPSGGKARVYSGANASIIYEVSGDTILDFFVGTSARGAGDVNADGVPDFIVGTGDGRIVGYVRVFSGLDGSQLFQFDADELGDFFGRAVDGAGDVNGDGHDDLIVGAWLAGLPGSQSGEIKIYSGMDGSILYEYGALSDGGRFGFQVAGVGDIDQDGFDDFGASAPRHSASATRSGIVIIYSGIDGSILYEFPGLARDDQVGFLDGAGDVNADGVPDIVIGAGRADPHEFGAGYGSGAVRVYSGLDGSLLHEFAGDSYGDYLSRVAGPGDVNGDGYDDILAGATQWIPAPDGTGYARIYSGMDGSIIYTLFGDNPQGAFGEAVAFAGDLNQDGLPEFMVSALNSRTTDPNLNMTRIYSPRPPFLTLRYFGSRAHFKATGLRPGENAYLVVSARGPGQTPLPLLGVVLDLANIRSVGDPRQASAAGEAEVHPNIPARFAGRYLWFQAAQQGLKTNVTSGRVFL